MAIIYARVTAGVRHDAADRFGVRAGFRGRRVQAGEIAVDQERDEWREFEFAAPLAVRAIDPSLENSKAYILHKEQDGAWFVDRWTADGAGAVRAASPGAAAANEHTDGCFIIEIGHAGR